VTQKSTTVASTTMSNRTNDKLLLLIVLFFCAPLLHASTCVKFEHLSPLQVAWSIELHIRNLIADKKVDRNIDPISKHGVGPEYSVEITHDEIVIHFDEDHDKLWSKSTTYRIRCESPADWTQSRNPKTSVTIESIFGDGFQPDVHLIKLEDYRSKETQDILSHLQKTETSPQTSE
jgi:hypothetical protein